MNTEARKGADGTSRCSTTHLLRSRSNIIFVAAKSFEICGRALRMHARVLESMRHHESSLLHTENGRCWRSHAHQYVANRMVARANKYSMIARREHRFWTPRTLVGHQCGVRSRQYSTILNRRRRAKKSVTMLTD